mmetsp:Transcript_16635/g.43980  ORF Transcript_16635/g.43980 Transcript_16635/m.43980 type:complete len:212 (+) Transcript_16635:139-774(+)
MPWAFRPSVRLRLPVAAVIEGLQLRPGRGPFLQELPLREPLPGLPELLVLLRVGVRLPVVPAPEPLPLLRLRAALPRDVGGGVGRVHLLQVLGRRSPGLLALAAALRPEPRVEGGVALARGRPGVVDRNRVVLAVAVVELVDAPELLLAAQAVPPGPLLRPGVDVAAAVLQPVPEALELLLLPLALPLLQRVDFQRVLRELSEGLLVIGHL